jgi:hypothetical protein
MLPHFRPLPVWISSLFLVFLGFLTYLAWSQRTDSLIFPQIATMTMFILGLADGLMLVTLPRLHLSYGSPGLPWFFILGARLVLLFLTAIIVILVWPAFPNRQAEAYALITWWIANLSISAVAFYGMYIEPFDLQVTEIKLPGPSFLPDHPLRIIQLADLHVERTTKRERAILSRLETLRPDLIVLTGDYLNFDYNRDPRAIQDARAFLSRVHAPWGVFAIPGSRAVDLQETMRELFTGLDITVLNDQAQTLSIGSGALYLAGVQIDRSGHDRVVLSNLMQEAPSGAYRLLLYHSPDLIGAGRSASRLSARWSPSRPTGGNTPAACTTLARQRYTPAAAWVWRVCTCRAPACCARQRSW